MLMEKKLEVERQKALRQENGVGKAEESISNQKTIEPEMQPDQRVQIAVEEEEEEEEDRAENEQVEKQAPHAQKSMASSREKRESRRQRGLEHNKLQNKHVSFALEGQPGAPSKENSPTREVVEKESCSPEQYDAGDAVSSEPFPKSAEEDGAQMSGENHLALNGSSSVSNLPLELKQEEEAANVVNTNGLQKPENPKIRVSQSFTCPERPSELSLNLQNNLAFSKSFRSSTNKSKQGASKDLGSPTSFPIQRYQDDPGKLRYKRERWKDRRHHAERDEMHSHSLEESSGPAQSPPPLIR